MPMKEFELREETLNLYANGLLHWARVEVPDSCSDFKGRVTSGFRPKLHSCTESLESLDKSRVVGCESLKIWSRNDSWSSRLCLGLESRAVSTSVTKVLKVDFLVVLARPVAPLLFESRRLHVGLESCAVSI